jgi:hypothetical protein
MAEDRKPSSPGKTQVNNTEKRAGHPGPAKVKPPTSQQIPANPPKQK